MRLAKTKRKEHKLFRKNRRKRSVAYLLKSQLKQELKKNKV